MFVWRGTDGILTVCGAFVLCVSLFYRGASVLVELAESGLVWM